MFGDTRCHQGRKAGHLFKHPLKVAHETALTLSQNEARIVITALEHDQAPRLLLSVRQNAHPEVLGRAGNRNQRAARLLDRVGRHDHVVEEHHTCRIPDDELRRWHEFAQAQHLAVGRVAALYVADAQRGALPEVPRLMEAIAIVGEGVVHGREAARHLHPALVDHQLRSIIGGCACFVEQANGINHLYLHLVRVAHREHRAARPFRDEQRARETSKLRHQTAS